MVIKSVVVDSSLDVDVNSSKLKCRIDINAVSVFLTYIISAVIFSYGVFGRLLACHVSRPIVGTYSVRIGCSAVTFITCAVIEYRIPVFVSV